VKVGANGKVSVFNNSGRGGVPADDVSAVVLNITVVNATAASHLTAFPGGQVVPLASNVNFRAGQVVPNRAIVKVGSGQVNILNNTGDVDVIIDVAGWFTDGSKLEESGAIFTAHAPQRVLDTRDGTGGHSQAVVAGAPIRFQMAGRGGVPALGGQVPATAIVANVTVVGSSSPSHLTLWPGGSPQPLASDLNFSSGQAVPNLTVVKVGPDGSAHIATNTGSVDVIIDDLGYYSGDVQFSDRLTVLDAGARAALSSSTPSSLTFTPSPPQLATLQVGDVLASEPSPNAPSGFLRKVDGITPIPGGVAVTTSDAALDDALIFGDLSDQLTLTAADLQSPAAPANTTGGATAEAGEPSAAGIDQSIKSSFNQVLVQSGGTEIRLQGAFELVAHTELDVKVRPTGVKAHFESSADKAFAAALVATFGATFNKKTTR
jgi:hypothetical protein